MKSKVTQHRSKEATNRNSEALSRKLSKGNEMHQTMTRLGDHTFVSKQTPLLGKSRGYMQHVLKTYMSVDLGNLERMKNLWISMESIRNILFRRLKGYCPWTLLHATPLTRAKLNIIIFWTDSGSYPIILYVK
jgi:hypothetical protein